MATRSESVDQRLLAELRSQLEAERRARETLIAELRRRSAEGGPTLVGGRDESAQPSDLADG